MVSASLLGFLSFVELQEKETKKISINASKTLVSLSIYADFLVLCSPKYWLFAI
jgi:hypothetical protein